MPVTVNEAGKKAAKNNDKELSCATSGKATAANGRSRSMICASKK
jgi:hypothetical protein